MADALVSALVSTILNNLDSLFRQEVGFAGSLKTELESLQRTFTTIQAVLHDAEQKQWKSEAIKNWLRNLEQAAYDLQDVLDDFQSEARGSGSKLSTFFSLQNPLLLSSIMAHRVKTAREKVDAIAEERIKFHLEVGVEEAEIERNNDRETSSLVNESEVFGRADEKGEMVSMMLSNATHHDGLSVYAICGMGGLGKTTIAQLVYNDQNVAKAFDLRVWVCVSDDFDVKRLTKAIVESIEGKCDIQELDPLQRRLVEKLVGKRFLIVLDDVWNESRDKWDRLKQALQSGGRGSAVIVTTRLVRVALIMATVPFRRLGCLTDGDSWSLFKQRVFGMGTNEGNADLETIGRQIVQRCGGVPLAIKAMGSILSSKSQESEWLNVRDSEIWDLEDEGGRILAVLRLSYEHLPSYMRQCFSFCSIFPKDHVMKKDELIGLWMANGFIPARGQLDLHDMGCEIFSELTRRSFFQEINEHVDGTVTCKMHDLIHDVATSIKGYECCAIEPGERLKIPKTARHLFVHNRSSSRNIMDLSKLPPLRSLILNSNPYFDCNISNPSNFISNQKHLKVLDCDDRFSNATFCSLKHLRYLRLNGPFVKVLSESISSLYNLQTLNLQRCKFLEVLPNGLRNLKNLKYLDLRGCDGLIYMPVGLGQLTCLRKLSKFVVGVDKGGGIDVLKELALEGELSITGLWKVKNPTEARNANLIEKKYLRSLGLSWHRKDWESCCHQQHGNDEEILDALQPHPSLKKLWITDYQGVRFPNWMMDLLLPNLVEIELEDCGRCDQLPPLGKLRFLKVLTIRGMGALKRMDNGFYGDMESSFPSLKVLIIDGAGSLEEWRTMNGGEHFPVLSSLSIRGCCPKLVKLPMLQSLKELFVGNANVSLLKSLMMNATNLASLELQAYSEPMDIPDGLVRNHKHLERLLIGNSSLKSSSDLLDNLSSLKWLHLQHCSQLESLPRGLQNLSCLERLRIIGCENLVSLAANGLQGLSSLSSLEISSCGNLTSLPESIQHLSSLRLLRIEFCERLSGLPNEIQHLTSLSTLEIYGCPNVMSLPQGVRTLTALRTLIIRECPQLERRCKEERGEDWPYIAHIPDIHISSDSDDPPSFIRHGHWTCSLSRIKARFCSRS